MHKFQVTFNFTHPANTNTFVKEIISADDYFYSNTPSHSYIFFIGKLTFTQVEISDVPVDKFIAEISAKNIISIQKVT